MQVSSGSAGYSAEKMILSRVNLTVHKGDRIAIVGNNGSGKSTLFKAIMGLIPTTGVWHTTSKSQK